MRLSANNCFNSFMMQDRVNEAKRSVQICKHRNDNRGCTARQAQCPFKLEHVCDAIRKQDGKVCGSRAHVRADCPERLNKPSGCRDIDRPQLCRNKSGGLRVRAKLSQRLEG